MAKLQKRMGVHFGRWLKARRSELGLTTEALGGSVGCSRMTISLLEHGKLDPSRGMKDRLAGALGVTIDEVVIATYPDEFDEADRERLRRWLAE